MKYHFMLLGIVFVLVSCKSNNPSGPGDGSNEPSGLGKYTIVQAFPDLPAISRPVELTAPDDGSDRIFVVSVGGVIHQFKNVANANTKSIFLDVSSKVASGGELGLLGLAFSLTINPVAIFI